MPMWWLHCGPHIFGFQQFLEWFHTICLCSQKSTMLCDYHRIQIWDIPSIKFVWDYSAYHGIPTLSRHIRTKGQISSWRLGEIPQKLQYKGYIKKWLQFSIAEQINSLEPFVNSVLKCLMNLYSSGLGYSVLNTSLSGLSTIVTLENQQSAGNYRLVKRFMRGVFHNRPTLLRYSGIWDVSNDISKHCHQMITYYFKTVMENLDACRPTSEDKHFTY